MLIFSPKIVDFRQVYVSVPDLRGRKILMTRRYVQDSA
jgi:hypothetical protein